MAFETFADVTESLPRFLDEFITTDGYTQRSAISAPYSSRINTPGKPSNQRPGSVRPKGTPD